MDVSKEQYTVNNTGSNNAKDSDLKPSPKKLTLNRDTIGTNVKYTTLVIQAVLMLNGALTECTTARESYVTVAEAHTQWDKALGSDRLFVVLRLPSSTITI